MDYAAILRAGFAKPIAPERPIGSARVFVSVVGKDNAKGIAKAAKQLGKTFQKKTYYGDLNALYVGYDNGTGQELARGSAIVAALNEAGIEAYRSEQGD